MPREALPVKSLRVMGASAFVYIAQLLLLLVIPHDNPMDV